MRLTFTTPGAPPAVFVLGDDTQATTVFTGTRPSDFASGLGGGIVEGSRPHSRWRVQKTDLFRAADPAAIARFNLDTTYSFSVGRAFQNDEMCGLFVDTHDSLLPAGAGIVTLTHYFGSAFINLYRPSAFIENAECVKHEAVYCIFQYQFYFNAPVTTASPL